MGEHSNDFQVSRGLSYPRAHPTLRGLHAQLEVSVKEGRTVVASFDVFYFCFYDVGVGRLVPRLSECPCQELLRRKG